VIQIALAIRFTPQGVRYCPMLEPPVRRLSFDLWWKGIVLLQSVTEVELRPRHAVLELANTDGGTHVDPTLNEAYVGVSRNNVLGGEVTLDSSGPGMIENSPVLPIVRQTAHEVIHTLREQLPELLSNQRRRIGIGR
jgi:hypothetical protein